MGTKALKMFTIEAIYLGRLPRSNSCLEEADSLRFHKWAHHTVPDTRLVSNSYDGHVLLCETYLSRSTCGW